MTVSLVTPSQVFGYLEITPSSTQTTNMTTIVNSVIADIKQFCGWCVVEEDHVDFLPQHGQVHGHQLRSFARRPGSASHQDRLQLRQMYVTAVSEVKEDAGLEFGSDSVLVVDVDWRPERREGVYSKSGGLLRIGRDWLSIPLSIKVSYTAGFSESDLAGAHNGLRFRALKECIHRWFIRQQEINTYGGDTTFSGTVRKEKIGDYELQLADPSTQNKEGLTESLKQYLRDCGYIFKAIGV